MERAITTTSRILFLLILLTSCTVTLLAPYDEVTDQKTTELHEKVLLQLNRWYSIYELDPDSSVLEYKNNFEFYNQSITTTEILLSRNQGQEKNQIVIRQLDGLLKNLKDMKYIHQEDTIMDTVDVASFKRIFDVQLGAIQKFQQVRKGTNKTE